MPTRARKKRPRDTNQLAWTVVQEATGQAPPEPPDDEQNPAYVTRASKGGKARSSSLTPAKRKEIAKKAAQARWKSPK